MRTKQKKHSLAMRLAALGLTVVMIIPMIGSLGINAKAATSLNGIEEIKNEKKRLSILEIVPRADAGSIGYYVEGKEPTANWLDILASKTGTTAREEYAHTLFDNLQKNNLMGTEITTDTTTYPLAYQGDYTEMMPWVFLEQGGTGKGLRLQRTEQQVVQGTFTPNDNAGHYIQETVYDAVSDGTGSHVENALYYRYGEPTEGMTYYYHVVFNRLELTVGSGDEWYGNLQDYLKTPLYELVQQEGNLPYYRCLGTLENNDFVFDQEKYEGSGYFIASVVYDSKISTTWETCHEVVDLFKDGEVDAERLASLKTLYTGTLNAGKTIYTVADRANLSKEATYYTQDGVLHSYYAVLDSNPETPDFRSPEAGEVPYFKEVTVHRFVGNGEAGDVPYFDFKMGTGKNETIRYDMVFYTGGYTSNEWFKRYVLDMDRDFYDVEIKVNSVTPDRLTKNTIQNADLVVISAGFDLDTGAPIEYAEDIKSDYYDEIIQQRRVVDLNLRTAASLGNNTKLIALMDGNNTPSVTAENVYYFARTTADNKAVPLATNLFHTKFADPPQNSPNPYQVVSDEITYENLLRNAAAGGTSNDQLSSDISMATCFRYVINTHLAINKKTSLRVLDIRPVAKYDQIGEDGLGSDDSYLDVNTVLSWLPNTMRAQLAKKDGEDGEYNITITHMSTSALVGKLEDISEEYDLIYIGAATTQEDQAYLNLFIGSGTNGVGNEYHYANIGAVATVDDRRLGGVLESDAASIPANPTSLQTRFSGNDLTPGKRDELIKFAQAGMPIVLAQQLVEVGDPLEAGKFIWSVTLEPIGNSIQATPNVGLLDTPYEASFEWERWKHNSSIEQWWFGVPEWELDRNYSASHTSDTIHDVNTSDRYRCTVTIRLDNGKTSTAKSDMVMLTNTEQTTPGRIVQHPDTDWIYHNDDAYVGKVTLTHEIKTVDLGIDKNRNVTNKGFPSYQWYVGLPSDDSSHTANLGGTSLYVLDDGSNWFYCKIEASYYTSLFSSKTVYITSPAYKWQPAQTTTTSKLEPVKGYPREDGIINNYGAAGDISLDNEAIDPNSKMYEALNSVIELDNIMAENQLTPSDDASNSNEMAEYWIMQQQETLVNYLNLSRPSLDLIEWPLEYDGEIKKREYKPSVDLNFTFKINNPTDATPVQTRYRCYLYIDQNGDGRHSQDERVYDFQIKEIIGEGSAVSVANGALQGNQQNNGKTYRLTRQLDASQFNGLVAWKLEVVKEPAATATEAEKEAAKNVHASEKGYTYIQPETPTPIKVLQIKNSYPNDAANTANLATPYEAEGTEWELDPPNNMTAFQELYKDLYDAKMYDITVDTKTVNQLNGMSDPFEELNKYEMIVLGFGDMYGDLDEESAQAVARYIDTGKAVLFTHDTTSIWNREKPANLDWKEYLNQIFGQGKYRGYWGYQFNKIIRDKVGLDRYGVTNTDLFHVIDDGEPGLISPEMATELEKAGYTVAYETSDNFPPNTSSGKNQGFSNLTIARYQMEARNSTGSGWLDNLLQNPFINGFLEMLSGGGAAGTTETDSASQVNRGHITEYPYKLDKTLEIGDTHEQYYQLNMNAEDITVWYCLSGSNYVNFKNDATNAYYVYNRGNITYSGAGHSDLSDDEAKLFVNTMIAAYRAGPAAPSVSFKTAAGDNTTVQLVPVEYSKTTVDGTTTTTTHSLSGQQHIYFEVQDSNLDSDKYVTVKLSYEPLAGSTTDDGTTDDGTADKDLTSDKSSEGPLVIDVTPSKVYRADTSDEITLATQTLSSGVLYRMEFPTTILNYFAKLENEENINLYLKVITTLKGTDIDPATGQVRELKKTGFDVLTLQHLGLLRLE